MSIFERFLSSCGIHRECRGDKVSWRIEPARLTMTTLGVIIGVKAFNYVSHGVSGSLEDSNTSASSSNMEMLPAAEQEVSFSELMASLKSGEVTRLALPSEYPQPGDISGIAVFDTTTEKNLFSVILPYTEKMLVDSALARGVPLTAHFQATFTKLGRDIAMSLLGTLGMAAVLAILRWEDVAEYFREGVAEAPGEKQERVRFRDVAGMEEVKGELSEVISFIRNPETYSALGALPPRGILLEGPAGTGKTLLAKAVAGECGVPFFHCSAASFVEVYVGQGAKRVREVFMRARSQAPCILFIDEIDAVGFRRSLSADQSGSSDREYVQTLNQLLVELDGFNREQKEKVVVVMGATNRYSTLDEALCRPGRLGDRIIHIPLPDFSSRVEILKVHARQVLLSSDCSLPSIAEKTEGWSGADLKNLLQQSALLSVRRGLHEVRMEVVVEVLEEMRGEKVRRGGRADRPWNPELFAENAQMWKDFVAAFQAPGERGGERGGYHVS